MRFARSILLPFVDSPIFLQMASTITHCMSTPNIPDWTNRLHLSAFAAHHVCDFTPVLVGILCMLPKRLHHHFHRASSLGRMTLMVVVIAHGVAIGTDYWWQCTTMARILFGSTSTMCAYQQIQARILTRTQCWPLLILGN